MKRQRSASARRRPAAPARQSRKQQGEQTRRAILQAAVELYSERGLRGTGLMTIGERAGVMKIGPELRPLVHFERGNLHDPADMPNEHFDVERELDARSAAQVTITAILINILNPKLSIFFLAFLPQFVSTAEANPLMRMLELSAVFMLMTFVVFVGYGLFAAAIRDHVISRPRVVTWMRRTFAGAFVALGAQLAVSER